MSHMNARNVAHLIVINRIMWTESYEALDYAIVSILLFTFCLLGPNILLKRARGSLTHGRRIKLKNSLPSLN
jgi:hypothetical protein